MFACPPIRGEEGVVLQSLRGFRVIATLIGVVAWAVSASAQSAAPDQGQAPQAQTPPQTAPSAVELRADIDRLRKEFETVRDTYGERLSALESKLAELEKAGTAAPAAEPVPVLPPEQPAAATPPPQQTPPPQPPPTQPPAAGTNVPVPQGAAGAGGPEGALPVYGNTSALSKIFNPDMAVIGNFVGAAGSNTVDPLPAMELQEAEASFQAVVDPYARADFFLSASPEGLDVEEGYITFTGLPAGLLLKVGKMKAQFGKVNTMHSHVLPWVDVPLPMKNLLGGDEGLNDAGMSVSKLIANPFIFLEATGEVYKGDNDLFTSYKRSDLAYVARLRGYRDLSEGTNLDVGTSFAYGHNPGGVDTTTRLYGFDATFRYRPLRRAIYKRLLARTELFWSHHDEVPLRQDAFGGYVSGEYQFAQRWFAGGRYDWSDRATNASVTDKSGSVLLTYWPSEFSQIRGQYRRTNYGDGPTANELLFQFLFSIGAHGAHVF
jgi:hypothetical protein